MRVLIVEDHADLAQALRAGLAGREVAADLAACAGDAEQMIQAARYAAMVLDLGLPDGDGLDVLRRLRARADPLPVLVLTARGDVDARIAGLHAGADDYLVKPFAMDELHARLVAVLRREGSYLGRVLACGDVRLDTATRELQVGARTVALSAREGELIELLLRRAGRVVSKRIAEDQLFGLNEELGSNAVEVYVHRLRRRLEQAGARVEIHTVRGVGYLLREAG